MGDAGDPQMLRATRVHAIFAKYMPLCLVLIAFYEVQGTLAPWLRTALAALFAGSVSHAFGVSQVDEPFGFRVLGIALTLTCCRLWRAPNLRVSEPPIRLNFVRREVPTQHRLAAPKADLRNRPLLADSRHPTTPARLTATAAKQPVGWRRLLQGDRCRSTMGRSMTAV